MSHFVIPYQIKPQPRPRVVHSTSIGYRPGVRVLDKLAKEKEEIKEFLRLEARLRNWEIIPRDRPIRVRAVVVVVKKNHSKREFPIGDVDNIAKTLLDCLTGTLIEDDIQVMHLDIIKVYGINRRQMALIEISDVDPEVYAPVVKEIDKHAHHQAVDERFGIRPKKAKRSQLEPGDGKSGDGPVDSGDSNPPRKKRAKPGPASDLEECGRPNKRKGIKPTPQSPVRGRRIPKP